MFRVCGLGIRVEGLPVTVEAKNHAFKYRGLNQSLKEQRLGTYL